MSGQEVMRIDTWRARATLDDAAREVEHQSGVHGSTRPALDPAAAGRDLAPQGAALAAALARLHDSAAARLHAVGRGISVVDGHVGRAAAVEADNDLALTRLPGIAR
ncbi:hypothetical protein [Corynebacterium frankenforstense]|uniref:hypothetical protein n=1 Tax=Corynebacterium frankenforstense TaxID=1230998 RepID=UPI0009526AC0|nr:hypothetical protein [Corynebacterium frankenforstense]